MSLAAAAAAGRYGHVIFPDVVHAPAVQLSQKLIDGPGSGWASRVFFTDDGSTAMEVAIKMGMKLYQTRHDISDETRENVEWLVCAQQDCYHGDTLGVMDVAEPSIFNEKQHPWYEPKGIFLATPTLGYHDGSLEISFSNNTLATFATVEEVMNVAGRLSSDLYLKYVNLITEQWDSCEEDLAKRRIIGSVVMEPILMGAGGMKFVDPLWQRALMDVAKVKKVPVIFDEVASGFYRVGVQSCREILQSDPDIASYAKLLTGGLVPLSVTLATEEVFASFLSDEKGQALLHGHSYTAHPIGCVSAIHALETYESVLNNQSKERLQLFDEEQTRSLSRLPLVKQSFSLGTVLAVTIEPEDGAGGYGASSRTLPLVRELRRKGVYARPLGNVIYIMASPLTNAAECARLCDVLYQTIAAYEEEIIAARNSI